MMAQSACNNSIQEAVAGKVQPVQEHPGIYTEFQPRINREILSQITKTKKKKPLLYILFYKTGENNVQRDQGTYSVLFSVRS